MSDKLKDIDIKIHKYYFIDDTINIKILIQEKLKQMKGYTKVTRCMTIRDSANKS